jgi:Peptidase family S41
MRWSSLVFVAATLSTLAVPQSLPSPSPPAPPSEPCSLIRPLIAKSISAEYSRIPADLARDCMLSVPLNATAAIEWIQSLKPYLAWQTNVAYLKDPLFKFPPVDINGTLDWMIANIYTYRTEWHFQWELYRLLSLTGDAHLRYIPALIGAVFSFGRPLAAVSVSLDGQRLPQLYVYDDILHASMDASFEPSPMTVINGIEAVAYMSHLASYGSLLDRDAQYNDLMYNMVTISLGSGGGSGPGIFAGGGRGALIYPNATTEITFENGSSVTYQNYARVLQDFINITKGQDVFDEYLGSKLRHSVISYPWDFVQVPDPAPGYPIPVSGQFNNFIRGFYLHDAGYEDVAIMSVQGFDGDYHFPRYFQSTVTSTLRLFRKDGKKRLVLDLRANGGGVIHLAYDLFLQLFPDLFPYGATRFRAHESFNLIGQTASLVAPANVWNFSDILRSNYSSGSYWVGTPFQFPTDTTVSNQSFKSWNEKFGPHQFQSDFFTSILRWNLSDQVEAGQNGFNVTGFGDSKDRATKRTFEPEQIVILYDGYCASACAILSEMLTQQAGIKTVVVGGAPSRESMQTVGGTRGTNGWSFNVIQHYVNLTLELVPPDQAAYWRATELGRYTDLPMLRSADRLGYIGVRDGLRERDETQTPLQFWPYEADCRIFYEPSFTVDTVPLWKRVIDVRWGNASCIRPGSAEASSKRRSEGIIHGKRHSHRSSMREDEFEALKQGVDWFTDYRMERTVGDGQILP